jgi:formate dehydrogenase major subunit
MKTLLIVYHTGGVKTAQMADVVLPASASWAESEGTVTNSERRVQRVRKALEPPGNARDDIQIICDIATTMGFDWNHPGAEDCWDELRSLSPMHAGMSYKRLEELGGIQWPCVDENDPGSPFLHGRLWEEDEIAKGPRAPLSVVVHELPVDELSVEFPLRLTTVRTLDNYNTGVQTEGYKSPLRREEALAISPEDGASYGVADGEIVKVSSRRGSLEIPVRYDSRLRPGMTSATLHFPDDVEINVLTIEANDPKSGTAEFKASAIRIDKLTAAQAR